MCVCGKHSFYFWSYTFVAHPDRKNILQALKLASKISKPCLTTKNSWFQLLNRFTLWVFVLFLKSLGFCGFGPSISSCPHSSLAHAGIGPRDSHDCCLSVTSRSPLALWAPSNENEPRILHPAPHISFSCLFMSMLLFYIILLYKLRSLVRGSLLS